MAAIARGRGEPDHVVRAWLARALGAPRDEAAEIAIAHSAMLPLLVESDEPRPVTPTAHPTMPPAVPPAVPSAEAEPAPEARPGTGSGTGPGTPPGTRPDVRAGARPATEAEDAAVAPDPADATGAAGVEVPRDEAEPRVARSA